MSDTSGSNAYNLPSSGDLLTIITDYIDDSSQPNASNNRNVRLGTIDPAYTGVGDPRVLFDGETVMGTRTYPYLGGTGDAPNAGERVILMPVGNTFVIIGNTSTGGGTPVGSSIEGYWTAAPTGYLLEDAAQVSRTTYANLFAVIGTTFGAGNGSTTFTLPDSRGRVAVNKAASGTFLTLGAKAGAETHVMLVTEMPIHTHVENTSSYADSSTGINSDFIVNGGGTQRRLASQKINGRDAVNAANTGGGLAHNNLQPYIVTLRCIKW